MVTRTWIGLDIPIKACVEFKSSSNGVCVYSKKLQILKLPLQGNQNKKT